MFDSDFYSTSFSSPMEKWRRGRWREPVSTVDSLCPCLWALPAFCFSPCRKTHCSLFSAFPDYCSISPWQVPRELQRIFKSNLDHTPSLFKLYKSHLLGNLYKLPGGICRKKGDTGDEHSHPHMNRDHAGWRQTPHTLSEIISELVSGWWVAVKEMHNLLTRKASETMERNHLPSPSQAK